MAQVIGTCDHCGAFVNAAFVDAEGAIRLDIGAANAHWQESDGCVASNVSTAIGSIQAAQDCARSVLGDKKNHDALMADMNALHEEFEKLTGARWVADVAPLREWLSPDQIKAAENPTPESRVMLGMLVMVARAAYEKGRREGETSRLADSGPRR